MRRTRIAITEHARKLTAAHGLSGFTIEDVCAPAEISRRTFFNYFESKEAAVVGATPADLCDSDAMRAFVAAGIADGQVSPTLLTDLVEVAIVNFDEVIDIAGTLTHVNAIIMREPAFMDKFIADSEAMQQQLVQIIAAREGLSPEDPRISLAVQLLGGLLHATAHSYFSHAPTGSIGPALRQSLAYTRELFAPAPTQAPAPAPVTTA
ncbi:AcrR family transcriptional regulator [Leucobacter exalbidus]|uniref:AcrR family transcriptional regulator n=1 Tax=Leucobacter exalbidus TaxID=662960 RepID=A0A940T2B2_9MICO|nr:TetR/AcrR family transcriptional regulator [Leucobacter exalbidus]MBP1324857.1 AcrR family transcriptional regulator [Leucobacter exalbidus]